MQPRPRPLVRTALLTALSAAALIAGPAQAGRHLRRGPHPEALVSPDKLFASNVVQPNLAYCADPSGASRVLSTTRIVAVFWGTPDTAAAGSACTGSLQICLDAWYKKFVASSQFDWLDEYATAGQSSGTNQHINHATYYGSVVITPSNTAKTIGEVATETEIVSQIQAGHLPAPDAHSETIYEVHFPLSVDPSDGNNNYACYDFCAYHDAWVSNILGKTAVLAIIPSHLPPGYPSVRDSGATTGLRDCSGCGERTDWFDNLSGSISHETIEAITDPDVSLSNTSCAWYDNANADAMSYHAEIGDMCEDLADQGVAGQITTVTLTAADGGTYAVQREWSNKYSACLADEANAFTLYGPSGAVAVPVGASTRMSISTSPIHSGAAASIALEAHGLPSGVTAAFSPATIPAGTASVLTLTASSGAPQDYAFGISAESGITQGQTVVTVSAAGSTPILDGGAGGGTAGGSGGGTAGGSGGGTAGGSGGGSGGGTAGGSGGGTAGGAGGGTAGGSGGGTAGGSGGGSAGGSGGGASTNPMTAQLSPSALSLQAGSSAQTSLTVSDTLSGGAFTLATTAASGVVVSPASGTLGTPLTLTFRAAAGTPSASESIDLIIHGANGDGVTVPLVLTLSGDDASLQLPTELDATSGGASTFTLSSTITGGNAQQLALSAAGLPSGATLVFSPSTIYSGGTSTGTLTVPSTLSGTMSTITVSGQGPITKISKTTNLVVAGAISKSGGCNQADALALSLIGLFGLGRKKRKTAPA
jgi:hypothetical protein